MQIGEENSTEASVTGREGLVRGRGVKDEVRAMAEGQII